jgi:hypothetical protein
LNRIYRSQVGICLPDNEPWLKLVGIFIGQR